MLRATTRCTAQHRPEPGLGCSTSYTIQSYAVRRAVRAVSAHKLRGQRLQCQAGLPDSNDLDLLKQSLAQELARQPGVRIVYDNENEDEDEDETWEDIVAELGNPWTMNPGKIDPVEDLGLPPLVPASSPTTQPSPAPQAYVQILDTQAFEQLGSGEGRLILLDVREEGGDTAAAALQAARDAVLMRQPLSLVDAAFADGLRGAPGIVVLGSGNHLGWQACTRLTKVYKLDNVYYYEH